jgi:uncharacterized protein
VPRGLSFLLTLAAIVALVKLLVIWLEPRIAFYPLRGVQATPAAMSLPYVDLRIPTRDGETLHGWFLESAEPRAQVVFWHGNGGNLSLWLDVVAALRSRGFSVLAVDYRGYGGSTGSPSEKGLYRDGEATVQEFQRTLRKTGSPVIYWGRSIGAPVAAYTASLFPPDGLVLEAPMRDARSVLRSDPIMWGLSFLSSYRFPTSSFVRQYGGPLLVIHGDADDIVPFESGHSVFGDARSTQKEFAVIEGAGHNDLHLVSPERYWSAIDRFVALVSAGRE